MDLQKEYFRIPSAEDLSFVADNMRHVDRVEVECLTGGMKPLLVLEKSVSNADWALTWLDKNMEPMAIVGVSPGDQVFSSGCPWLLGTDAFGMSNARNILKNTMPLIHKMHEDYSVLWNRAWFENKTTIRWLEWGGFTMGAMEAWSGKTFVRFQRVRVN